MYEAVVAPTASELFDRCAFRSFGDSPPEECSLIVGDIEHFRSSLLERFPCGV